MTQKMKEDACQNRCKQYEQQCKIRCANVFSSNEKEKALRGLKDAHIRMHFGEEQAMQQDQKKIKPRQVL